MTVPATSITFAKRVFFLAGIYGLLVIFPQYFMEAKLNQDFPPAITHPEHFYGFIGVALAWQAAFLIISRDVIRYRLMMLPGVLEKFSFDIAAVVLFLQNRIAVPTLGFAVLDMLIGVFFLGAFWATSPRP